MYGKLERGAVVEGYRADRETVVKLLNEALANPVDLPLLLADLDANWEVLAEAIQTVVRAEIAAGRSKITDPYALLKDLTRGRRVGGPELAEFVRGLDIGDAAKERLLALTPATYAGLASRVVDAL